MKRAVIYARVSKLREESVSIEAQVQQCTERANKLGATVIRVFIDEGISGRETSNRRAFLKAKAFCAAAGIDFFITWSTSRFARNLLELFRSDAELRDVGTRLECLNADINDDTDAGFLNKAIHGLFDEMKSREVARDTLRSQKQSAAGGFFTGGQMPYGYRTVKDELRSRLAPDPHASKVVQRMFELSLQGHGAQAIAVELNTAGLVREGKRWGKNSVNYILKNELYTGVRTFNKTHRRTRTAKPRDQWIQVASHPALVSRDDFERTQAMLEERSPGHVTGGGGRSSFIFVGLLHCANCSERLQIRTGTSRAGPVYSYYACLGHKKGAPRCLMKALRADLLDEWLLGEILAKVITPAAMAEAMDELLTAGAAWIQERADRRARIVADIRDNEGRRDKLFELLEVSGKNTPDLAGVSRRLRTLSEAWEELQAELTTLEATPAPGRPTRVDPEIAVEVMLEVIARADEPKKRAFLGQIIERVTVGAAEVWVDYSPEGLLNTGAHASVRRTNCWLPVCGPLRTKRVTFPRPKLLGRHQSRRQRQQYG